MTKAISNINIRLAVESDLEAILEVIRAGAVSSDRYPPLDIANPAYLAAFRAIDDDPNNALIVAEISGGIIGTLQICLMPGLPDEGRSRGTLENIHVRAEHRGQGIGSQMINWAINYCREKNCWLVQLTSDNQRNEAHKLYGALGFEATHAGFKLRL